MKSRSQAVLNPIPIGPPLQIHPAKVDPADTSTYKSTSPSSLRHGPHETRYTLCTSILPLRPRVADDYCCPFRVHFESGPSHREAAKIDRNCPKQLPANKHFGGVLEFASLVDVPHADQGTAPSRTYLKCDLQGSIDWAYRACITNRTSSTWAFRLDSRSQ